MAPFFLSPDQTLEAKFEMQHRGQIPMKLSVIIPVRDGGDVLRRCLGALATSTRRPDEIIVVDDASTDATAQLASGFGALVQSQAEPIGPAKARNRGAEIAHGDILVFIDADVVVHLDALAVIESHFALHPEIAALFGSYDDDPPYPGLVSRYKNLQHHFVHQHSQGEASTFWTGLGAIRRDVFLQVGSFNESYRRPSIEDIELGVRLDQSGYRIWLCPDVLATHLKEWNLVSLLRTDIFDRAIPWTRLIHSSSQLPSNLNLDTTSRLSVLCLWIFILHLMAGFWLHLAWGAAPVWLALLIAANFSLYLLFYRKGGLWFALGAFGLHMFYFFYSSVVFGIVSIGYLFSRGNKHTSKPIRLDGLAREPRK
jgi:glycosyltransferase involved in cell wall biosynthesis